MNEQTEKNALALKLDHLENIYMKFSHETETPLLRWEVDPGDEDIVRVFVAYAQAGGTVDDIMVDMTVPFEDETTYANALTAELIRQYEADKPGMAEEGLDTGWVPPTRKDDMDDIAHMLEVLSDFHIYHVGVYEGSVHHLALVLRPKTLSAPPAFAAWVTRVLRSHPPAGIRLVVLDPVAAPQFDRLTKDEPQQVHSMPLKLDYPGMLEALAKGEGNQDGPDAAFRVLFVKLSNQAEKQDTAGVAETAAEALAIAEKENWYQMRVVVHMVRGASFMQVKQEEDALEAYRSALAVAREAKEAGDPAGAKLEIQTLFAIGSVLVAMTNYTKACEVYKEAAPLADTEKDYLFAMEGWRMAAFCYEMNRQYAQSMEHLELALDAGESLPEDQRAPSTLAYVGDALIRVIKAAKKARGMFRSKEGLPDEQTVDERMTRLLGEKWQSMVVRDGKGDTDPS